MLTASPRSDVLLAPSSTGPCMGRAHLVTGATGFLGAALIAELLRETNDPIIALVRPGDSSPEQRFRSAYASAAQAYGLEPDRVAAAASRCRAIAGDVTAERC